MTIEFTEMGELLSILNELKISMSNFNAKKWMSVNELAEYICYSKDAIHKMAKSEFLEGYHYFKKSGKLLFEVEKVDQWIRSPKMQPANRIEIDSNIDDIFKSINCS